MKNEEHLDIVVRELVNSQLELPGQQYSYEQLLTKISERIDYLIMNHFHLLIAILYRLDISETKLKQLLSSSPGVGAGEVIAPIIIERQLQKIASRKAFKTSDLDIPPHEKW